MVTGMNRLTHFDNTGDARMVDVGGKDETERVAVATGRVIVSSEAMRHVVKGEARKGDVLAVARLAGIIAAKRCPDLIPLCHTVPISSVEVAFDLDQENAVVSITAKVACKARTGVEMEALTAVSISALTIYDMLKSVDRGIRIADIRLEAKSGGKSGDYRAT